MLLPSGLHAKLASAFNQDIGAWDTSLVTTVANLFLSASAFDQPLGWCLSATSTAAVVDTQTVCSVTNCNITAPPCPIRFVFTSKSQQQTAVNSWEEQLGAASSDTNQHQPTSTDTIRHQPTPTDTKKHQLTPNNTN